jgi:hypothetical protein
MPLETWEDYFKNLNQVPLKTGDLHKSLEDMRSQTPSGNGNNVLDKEISEDEILSSLKSRYFKWNTVFRVYYQPFKSTFILYLPPLTTQNNWKLRSSRLPSYHWHSHGSQSNHLAVPIYRYRCVCETTSPGSIYYNPMHTTNKVHSQKQVLGYHTPVICTNGALKQYQATWVQVSDNNWSLWMDFIYWIDGMALWWLRHVISMLQKMKNLL